MPSIVIVAVGGFLTLVPVYRIMGRCIGKMSCYRRYENTVEKDLDENYENMRTRFLSEYDRSNPITHAKAMQEYFRFLESRPSFTEKPLPTLKKEKRTATW